MACALQAPTVESDARQRARHEAYKSLVYAADELRSGPCATHCIASDSSGGEGERRREKAGGKAREGGRLHLHRQRLERALLRRLGRLAHL